VSAKTEVLAGEMPAVPGMSNARRVDAALHLLTGGVIVAACIWWGWVRHNALFSPLLRVIGLVLGIGLAGLWAWSAAGFLLKWSRLFCLCFLSLGLTVGGLELFFRAIKFDFTRQEANWRRLPPFERQPMTPCGTVFFRRTGPERWNGQILNSILRQLHISPNPYRDEPKITVAYNELGFRNPEGLKDWEIAVAGDSFTEAGNLADEQLFTTVLGQALQTRVANLGTSYTGPLAQLSSLQEYGLGPSTRKTVIVFFEGNDLRDLQEEYTAFQEFETTGQRPYRKFSPQISMLRTVYRLIRDRNIPEEPRPPVVTAFFKSGHGPLPITLNYAPPGRSQIPADGMARLEYFFSQYDSFGKAHGVETWLTFMPCKERVVYGMVDFATNAPERFRQWQPTDLPELIGELAATHSIRFIDLTPTLLTETVRTKELVFNSIYDTHLTAQGSQLVGQELARKLVGSQ